MHACLLAVVLLIDELPINTIRFLMREGVTYTFDQAFSDVLELVSSCSSVHHYHVNMHVCYQHEIG